MLEFLKMFGLGIVYTICSPLILLFFLLFVVYSVFNYLVCEIIYLGGFFMGKKFDDKTPLEKKLAKIKAEKERQKEVNMMETSHDVMSEGSVSNEEGDLNV